jgi:nicotinamidase-related amidase
MDLQTAIVSIYTKGDSDLVRRAAAVLKEAREHRLSVIHVQVGFHPGLPEIGLRNPLLSAIKNSLQQQTKMSIKASRRFCALHESARGRPVNNTHSEEG